MTMLALGIGVASLRYFALSEETFFPEQRSVYREHLPSLLLHIGGGVAALVLGPWQFWGGLRARALPLHRWIGRLYLLAVATGGVGGLMMAPLAWGGPIARLGFLALGLAWLGTSGAAYVCVRRRRLRAHRSWMIRSYALTFAAVTLRLWLPLLQAFGIPFTPAYVAVAWLCWLPNLAAAEIYLARRRPARAAAAA